MTKQELIEKVTKLVKPTQIPIIKPPLRTGLWMAILTI